MSLLHLFTHRKIRNALSEDFTIRKDGRVLSFAFTFRIDQARDDKASTVWCGRVNPKFEWDLYDAQADIDARRKPGAPPILMADSTKEDPKYTLLWDVTRSRVTQPDTLAGVTKDTAGPDIQLSVSNEVLTENMGAVDVASVLSSYFFLPVRKPEPDVIRVLLRPMGPYCPNGAYGRGDWRSGEGKVQRRRRGKRRRKKPARKKKRKSLVLGSLQFAVYRQK